MRTPVWLQAPAALASAPVPIVCTFCPCRLRAEDEQRRQKFAVMNSTFAKKEAALRQRAEAAEQEAEAARAQVAQLAGSTGRLQAALTEAEQRLQEAQEAATAERGSLEQQVAEAQEAVRIRCAHMRVLLRFVPLIPLGSCISGCPRQLHALA